jgi:mannose-1-phosphate guanylyltransferase
LLLFLFLKEMERDSTIIHVILTGGVGSRLWPLSRKSQPKQYLEIFGGKSLFEMTVERNRHLVDKVMVVGNIDNYHLSGKVMEKTGTQYVNIVEATPRNTAAAIAFAAFEANPDDILIITPSDHIIDGMEDYNKAINEAIEKAQNNFIVTFGIVPTKPETGYGYIESNGDDVLSFREKPNETTAKDFISKGNFLWNSGMFCFKAHVLLEELYRYQPDVYEKAKKASELKQNDFLNLQLSLEIPSISIDYAVMERSKKIKVVNASFSWSDLGSFESVYDYLLLNNHPVDKNGNMVIGCNKHTTFLGLKNTIFVYTDTANLILQKESSQNVKDIYSNLERENSELLN